MDVIWALSLIIGKFDSILSTQIDAIICVVMDLIEHDILKEA